MTVFILMFYIYIYNLLSKNDNHKKVTDYFKSNIIF